MNHIPHGLEPEHIANFTKLADYLAVLPADYHKFAMDTYASRVDYRLVYQGDLSPEDVAVSDGLPCDTVACALGHGPAAGINPHSATHSWPSRRWEAYAADCFGASTMFHKRIEVFRWCFSGSWVDVDNTPQGAALRIRYMLLNGVPNDAIEQMHGEADYLFKKGA